MSADNHAARRRADGELVCVGRVVVVTGAGRGVGRAHALEFARHGARVIVNDLGSASDGSGASTGPADEVVAEIHSMGGEAIADHHDVSDWAAADALIAGAIRHYGKLDVLVNNAGILRDRMIVNMTEGEWDAVVGVHLKGTVATTRAAAVHWRALSKQGRPPAARLINTTSSSGLFGAAGQSNYASAKAGIASFTIVASRELARYGVTANCIYPTAVSRLTEDLFHSRGLIDADGRVSGEAAELDPANVAPAVVWLGSVHSGHINGRVFGVRGNRIVLAEGWRAGPEARASEQWDAATVGDVLSRLDASGLPNAGTDGRVARPQT